MISTRTVVTFSSLRRSLLAFWCAYARERRNGTEPTCQRRIRAKHVVPLLYPLNWPSCWHKKKSTVRIERWGLGAKRRNDDEGMPCFALRASSWTSFASILLLRNSNRIFIRCEKNVDKSSNCESNDILGRVSFTLSFYAYAIWMLILAQNSMNIQVAIKHVQHGKGRWMAGLNESRNGQHSWRASFPEVSWKVCTDEK